MFTAETVSLNSSEEFHSLKIKPEIATKKKDLGNNISFLLCEACYWCASYFNSDTTLTRCPKCGNDNVESMPIANGEVYTFSHNRYRGITLEFSNHKGVLN